MPAPNDTTMGPLIFGPRSIRAWQQDAKSQTRRLVRPQPAEGLSIIQSEEGVWVAQDETLFELLDQPYAVGDLLWIREKLRCLYDPNISEDDALVFYDIDQELAKDKGKPVVWPWKRATLPAMFMPKWACRYYVRLVSVRAERVQDISDEDAIAEGTLVDVEKGPIIMGDDEPGIWYAIWWDSLHKKPGTRWQDNPSIFVYGLEDADASTSD